MPTLTKLYSMEEASTHNSHTDCWVVVDGKAYDVTPYLDEHPGGADVMLSATGKDATEEFEDAGHSKAAREQMQEYCVGELDPTPDIPEMEVFRKEQNSNSDFTSMLMSKSVQYLAIPAAILGISAVTAILYARKK